ncbi:MAG: aminotransferase class I/II-fold pyridoxal phosphate-dependent enzyme [Myxococcales bacterium]|mgnify:CR=1 FL=1|nr:aminotransferase class I/II-fold pyridoxal phosphate-dependent enzyme [Myxococcales bacterium]HRC58751.1 aminotransferase class I/II-fold pyridoxal phosphate-dependent enzyme [Kofleriaceae bacterium]
MSQALRELLRAETDRLKDAGLYKREIVFTRAGGMAAGGMLRARPQGDDDSPSIINYTTHDYLGMSTDAQVRQAAIDAAHRYGIGVSSQRTMCGTLPIHKELEDWLRGFLQVDDVILFGTGYQANIGVFSPLFGARDCILCDGGIHPSLADGVRLSGARIVTFRNNDPDDLEDVLKRSRWARFRAVVTNGVHPFTGRVSDLRAVCDLAEQYDAMVIVDDCLGIGVLGNRGRGAAEMCGVIDRVDLVTGTFSKALGGAAGGFVAGRGEIVEWLRQKSPPYIFSSTLPPPLCGAAMAAVQILESGDAPLPNLRDNVRVLWDGLIDRGFRVLGGQHPLLVVEVGEYEMVREIVNHLYDRGIYAHGLCYPVVPEGQASVRLLVSSLHSAEHLQRTLAAFESARGVASFAVDALAALGQVEL